MKKYLYVKHEQKRVLIDLDTIRQIHTQFVEKVNRTLHPKDPPIIANSAEEITKILFMDEDYITSWLDKDLSWHQIKKLFHKEKLNNKEWRSAKKMIVTDN